MIRSNLPSIAKIRKEDPEIATMVVAEFITDLVEFLNVGKIMNASQVSQTALYTLQYFPHFNLADLKLFFDKMKLGHFGSFYDRMDGQLILEKMEVYNQDRMTEFEQIRLQQDREIVKNNPIGNGYHPLVIDAIKKAVGDKKPFSPEAIEPRTQTKAEIFQKMALKQFDNLFAKYGINIGIRALKIGKSIFAIEDFIERKVNNKINFIKDK
ncbi:hypothetical protein [Sphingobacterium psychroaquaticum]|nr:hypothetical protein [Sphingobacterium psychroaquaticum]